MRKMRLTLAGMLCAAMIPASAGAQRMSDFEDSWFWGVKAGASTFSPAFGDTEVSATYGAEWLITRTRGALYVSVDQSDISVITAVLDPTAEGSLRAVQVDKLRRVSFAGMVFPKQFGRFRPYAGLGLTLNLIADAFPLVTSEDETVDDAVFQRIDDRKSQAAVLGIGGVQAQFRRLGVFAQASVNPVSSRFLLSDSSIGYFEAGLRYNFGGAREGLR